MGDALRNRRIVVRGTKYFRDVSAEFNRDSNHRGAWLGLSARMSKRAAARGFGISDLDTGKNLLDKSKQLT
jgi:predicted RNA-binding protein YlxR (DUF448 family)